MSNDKDLPPNWICMFSKTRKGKKYFFNTQTLESTWKRPEHGVSEPNLKKDGSVPSSKKRHKKRKKRKRGANIEETESAYSKKKKYASDSSETDFEQEKTKNRSDVILKVSGSAVNDTDSKSKTKSRVNRKSQSNVHKNSTKKGTSPTQQQLNRPVLKAQRKTRTDSNTSTGSVGSTACNVTWSAELNHLHKTRSDSTNVKSVSNDERLPEVSTVTESGSAEAGDSNKASTLGDKAKSSQWKPVGTLKSSSRQAVKSSQNQEIVSNPKSSQLKEQDSQGPVVPKATENTNSKESQRQKRSTMKPDPTLLNTKVTSASSMPLTKSSTCVSTTTKTVIPSLLSLQTSFKSNKIGQGQIVSSINDPKKNSTEIQSQKLESKQILALKPRAIVKSIQDQIKSIDRQASKSVPKAAITNKAAHGRDQEASINNNEKKGFTQFHSDGKKSKPSLADKSITNQKSTHEQIQSINKLASKIVPHKPEAVIANQARPNVKSATGVSAATKAVIPSLLSIQTFHKSNSSGEGQVASSINNSKKESTQVQSQTTESKQVLAQKPKQNVKSTQDQIQSINKLASKIVPKSVTANQAALKFAENNTKILSNHNENKTNFVGSNTVITAQTPLNTPRAQNIQNVTYLHTPHNYLKTNQPCNYGEVSSNWQTNVESNGNIHATPETHSWTFYSGNPPVTPSSVVTGLNLFPTNQFNSQPLDNQLPQPADNSSISNRSLHSFQANHHHEISSSIDLGSTVVESTRIIEDMDVDSDGTDESIHLLVLVIDTNVLIHSLPFLTKLIKVNVPTYGSPTFVLPWVVIQELDRLKVPRKTINTSNENLHLQAAAAVRFIHSHLVAKNQHVKGQTPQEAYEKTDLPIEMNDDKILHCCLQYQKKFSNSQLCLLTRDINLRNKAVIMGLEATDDDNLFTFLNVENPMNASLLKPVMKLVKEHLLNVPSKSTGDPAMIGTFRDTKNTSLTWEKSAEAACMLDAPKTTISAKSAPFKSTEDALMLDDHRESNNKNLNGVVKTENLQQRITTDREKNYASRNMGPVFEEAQTVQRTSNISEPMSNSNTSTPNSNNSVSGLSTPLKVLTPEETQLVLAKFESVWKLVFDVKNELDRILNEGKSGPRYGEGLNMLKTINTLVPHMCKLFESCLSLSPLIVQNHSTMFYELGSSLNSFFKLSGVETKDPNPPVSTDSLIAYFKESKNRVLLRSGLEQMENFSADYMNMLNSVS